MPLPAASVLFAVLWTAGMLWWSSPLDTVQIVILVIAGAIAGVLWHLLMRMFMVRFRKTR